MTIAVESQFKSINWPAPIDWIFIDLHCSAKAEATGSNRVEAPKNFLSATLQLLKLRFNCNGHIFISSDNYMSPLMLLSVTNRFLNE